MTDLIQTGYAGDDGCGESPQDIENQWLRRNRAKGAVFLCRNEQPVIQIYKEVSEHENCIVLHLGA